MTCHYNPAGYRNPRRNLHRFLRQMEAAGVSVFVAELAYGDLPWLLPESANHLRLRTPLRNAMWHKENLLNLLERMVPDTFDTIAWIDADIWFERRDWVQAAEDALKTRAVVQLFEKIVQTAEDGSVATVQPGAGFSGYLGVGQTTPGYAWAARRSLWKQAGGLYERAVIGGADTLQASVWFPTAHWPFGWFNYAGTPGSLERLRQWCASEGGCGGIAGAAFHEWHGDTAKRKYGERHGIMGSINVETDLVRRVDGLLEFSDRVPDWFRSHIQTYFRSRAEDGQAREFAQADVETASETTQSPNFKSRTEIINWLIRVRGFSTYLEIGVGDGKSFSEIQCPNKESVDPAEGDYSAAEPTHRVTSDLFFQENTAKFDLIFIDGLHHEDAVARDLGNALAALNVGGIVVCHDLNPLTEAMQAVPRSTQDWTGDGWKAWVKLSASRDDLLFAVADIDHGVGVIVTDADVSSPRLSVDEGVLDWQSFVNNRKDWLPLISPGKLAATLGCEPQDGINPPLAVVTLWRAERSDAQRAVLGYLQSEDFPKGTRFIWTVEAGSGTASWLESQWEQFEKLSRQYSLEMIETEPMPAGNELEKHITVATLYNEALKGCQSRLVLCVEDDVVPTVGTWRQLCMSLASEPRAAAVMGVYRTRQKHDCVCARDMAGVYFSWSVAGTRQTICASWIGAGLTLYRAEALRKCLPAMPEKAQQGWMNGWDVVVSQRLRALGGALFIDAGCVADHRV